jgi:hypothetical protein
MPYTCKRFAGVGLAREPVRGVAREARGDDHFGAGAQELDRRVVADLHPGAGDEHDPAAQVGGLLALGEVERRTRRAQLIVEVVELEELGLADVAEPLDPRPARRRCIGRAVGAPRLGGGPRVGLGVVAQREVDPHRRQRQRRAKHRLLAQHADPGLIEDRALGVAPLGLVLAREHLAERLAAVAVRPRHLPGRGDQANAQRLVELGERAQIAADLFEQLDRIDQPGLLGFVHGGVY